ncbi:MAG: hypothetical protein Q8M03_02525 [Legionella sp.]|nr:hypothetical protein [Legionella sp.]
MFSISVSYFLDEAGILFFNTWFEKVSALVSLQEGYVSIASEVDFIANPKVYLSFINKDKLTAWANTKSHDELVLELQKYYIKPHQVEFL